MWPCWCIVTRCLTCTWISVPVLMLFCIWCVCVCRYQFTCANLKTRISVWHFLRHTLAWSKSMGNCTIWPPAALKTLNRSTSKFTEVVTSSTSSILQNFIQIGCGVSFRCMRAFAHRNVYSAAIFSFFGVLQIVYAQDASTYFDAKYVKRCDSVQGCVFRGRRTKVLSFTPHFPPKKLPFWDPISTGHRHFLPQNGFNIGHAHL